MLAARARAKRKGGGALSLRRLDPALRPAFNFPVKGGPLMWFAAYLIGFFAHPIQFIRFWLGSHDQAPGTKEDSNDRP
jgi:hypothetical protein